MDAAHLFELLIAMLFAIIALHFLAHRLGCRLPSRSSSAAPPRVHSGPARDLSRSRAGARHLPAAAADGRGVVHPAPPAQAPPHRHPVAGRRRGGVHDARRRRRHARAPALAALGRLLCARRHRFAAGRHLGACGAAAGAPAAPTVDPPRGREPAQRRDRARAVPLRGRGGLHGHVQRGDALGSFVALALGGLASAPSSARCGCSRAPAAATSTCHRASVLVGWAAYPRRRGAARLGRHRHRDRGARLRLVPARRVLGGGPACAAPRSGPC